ncbi:MAG: GDP-mannose 4,6-dehydratase [Steroidobacteraceae bacterium]
MQTVVNYPVALPFLPAYRRFNHVAQTFLSRTAIPSASSIANLSRNDLRADSHRLCIDRLAREQVGMKLAGRKVLVTGADGFIGSHLVEHLVAQGADVRAFVYYNSFSSWGWLDRSPTQFASPSMYLRAIS